MNAKIKLKYSFPVLLFLLSAALATIFSVDFHQSLHVQTSLISSFFLYLFIIISVDTQKKLSLSLIVLPLAVLLGLFYLVPDILSVKHALPLNEVKKLDSVFLVAPNDVVMLAVSAPLIFGAAWCGRWWLKLLAVVYVFLAISISVNMQSRQAALLLLLGVVVVVAMMKPRWAIFALILGLSVSVLVDWLLGWPLASKIFMFPRTYVWHSAWMMFVDRPWTGQGPGLFKDLYFAYLDRAGYILDALPDRRPMNWAHSLYFEQLAERGLLGIIALFILLASALRVAIRTWSQSSHLEIRAISAGLVAALLVFIVAGIAETTFSRLWVTVLLLVLTGFVVATARVAEQ